MAKKKTAAKPASQVEVAQPEIKATNEMVNVVIEKPKPKEPVWEIKDRVYHLKGYNKPLSYSIKSHGIRWFDEEKGYERELMNTQNQRTVFVDEMVGDKRMSAIVFRNGTLIVPKEKTVL